MRKLYVTRGIPGSGKSTILQAAGLGSYTLSPDDLRLAMAAPVLDEKGKMSISAKDDRRVWELLRELLEARMARGEIISIDATHTTARYYNDYAQLAYKHRYQLFLIDLSGVPLEQAIAQNEQRAAHKVVATDVLRDMHGRLASLGYPKGWHVLHTVEEIAKTLEHPVVDFSMYTRVHHIGDIQGCYAPLAAYFERFPLRDDEAFVFTGDFLDRGRENDQVLDFVSQLAGKPNVYFVEGNHDMYIWQWLHGWPVKTREFNGRTRRQLEAADIDRQAVRTIFRSMVPALHYRHGERQVLVTHAGLSSLPSNLGLLSANQCIRGVSRYEQVGEIDDAFVQNTDVQTFQIHGHRNRQNFPIQYNERCFNLEGKVEFGGSLRVVQLTNNGFTPVEIANTTAHIEAVGRAENAKLIQELRNNRLISEKTLPENISSFHYRPEVMFKKKWSNQTITTRGLFINTLTSEIVIRGYDKFFNINETRQTDYSNLSEKLVFPVTAWVKENGYLGLVGYDDAAGDLIISSKSTTEGEFADWLRALFEKQIEGKRQFVIDYLRDHNASLLFEVVLPRDDPHIINYGHDELVLLDVVKRQRAYEAAGEAEREMVGKELGIRCKQKAVTLADWREFEAWYTSVQGLEYTLNGAHIEGFVIEDSTGWHVKIKLDYYVFWKQMRSALDAIKKGRTPRIPDHCAYPKHAAEVIAFMQKLPKERAEALHISDVRRMYLTA